MLTLLVAGVSTVTCTWATWSTDPVVFFTTILIIEPSSTWMHSAPSQTVLYDMQSTTIYLEKKLLDMQHNNHSFYICQWDIQTQQNSQFVLLRRELVKHVHQSFLTFSFRLCYCSIINIPLCFVRTCSAVESQWAR